MTENVQKWGQLFMVTKEMRADTGIDMDAYLRFQFDDSLPDGFKRLGDVEVEWYDADDPLSREMHRDFDLEPPEDVWFVRVTGRAYEEPQ